MGLRMCTPKRHPNSSNYWIRKRVPDELRPILQKREIKKSLATSDPREAKRRASAVCAEIDTIFEKARRSLKMGASEIEALKGEYLRERVEAIIKEAQRHQWKPEDLENATLSLSDKIERNIPANLDEQEYEEWRSDQASRLGLKAITPILKRRNLTPPPGIATRLGEEAFRAEYDAYRAAYANLFGDPEWNPPRYASRTMEEASTVLELFEEYAKNSELAPRTIDSWRTYLTRANSFFKSKTAGDIKKQDVRAFAEALQQGDKSATPTGKALSVKSINDNYLASLSAVYKWAIERDRLTFDPTKGVRLKERGRTTLPIIQYTREEVATILTATRVKPESRVKPETANVRRWVPWLCAFTGARISEILWLKREDIQETQGIHYINIRPDIETGRGTKTRSSIRFVPLHPAIINEGFLEYWKSVPKSETYLFPGNWSDKSGDRTKSPANKLREWLKAQLPKANWTQLNPNHSFRHWLTAECRIAKIDGDYARALTGHKQKDAHGDYGPGTVPILYNELKLIPSPVAPRM
ncbi:site-specific tyrosine recombinase XerD [Marinobacter litoralis]|uniref:Site-specific tyrosine recombinase XerD n=1 Tax=Marinobacter litoralis TaxID=187981 RepID=A0A3M2RJC1_9GAMM|nr:site-specific integrase [Marinobacter litoralis]RMJ05421.1 site-specific tyrosine recombinase XerD [Marinobacter litoralis]